MKYIGIIVVVALATFAAAFTAEYTRISFAYLGGQFLGGIAGVIAVLAIINYFTKSNYSKTKIFIVAIFISAGVNLAPKLYEGYKLNSIITLANEAYTLSSQGFELSVNDFEYRSDFEEVAMTYLIGSIQLDNKMGIVSNKAINELELTPSIVSNIIKGEITEERSAMYVKEIEALFDEFTALVKTFEQQSKRFTGETERTFLNGMLKKAKSNYEASKTAISLQVVLVQFMGKLQSILIENKEVVSLEPGTIVITDPKVLAEFNMYSEMSNTTNQELLDVQNKLISEIQSNRNKLKNF